jgi:hypothetical protein
LKSAIHEDEIRPRKDKRAFDLISDGCHSGGCGTQSRMMLSATRSFSVDHMTP